MKTTTDRAERVACEDGIVRIFMGSGVEYRIPVKDSPRLAKGSIRQLSNIEITPFGLHWPDLDEDLSFNGIARGDFGQGSGRR